MRPALIGDIGGTHARFALARNGGFDAVKVFNVGDYPSPQAAIEDYLAGTGGTDRPRIGAIALAGPVTGDQLSLTNHPWSFSVRGLTQALGFGRLDVVNDFVAQALAVPHLAESDRRQIGPGEAVPAMPIAVIGPGTGLGVSSLVPSNTGRWIALAGEGGHVTLPAVTAREATVIDRLHQSGADHVSAERLICGQGIVTLYRTLAELDGASVPDLAPAEITAQAEGSSDRYAAEAVAMFCALLGTIAGNLALTIGARGGVYIAGGIVPQLGERFDHSAFRARFTAKGRMQAFLDPIPTYVVIHAMPALLGLTSLTEGGSPA